MLDCIKETNIAGSLELEKVAKTSKIEMIKKEGVKEIILESSLYEASILKINKKEKSFFGIKKKIADELMRIFSEDPTLSNIREKENLNISLSVRFDGKEARGHLKEADFGVAGKERLSRSSSMIVEEYEKENIDGFTIITGSGNKITADAIRVSEAYKIQTFGRSISRIDAWDKLEIYFKHLKATGVLSQ
jgi:hypothetical protein